VFGIKSNEVQYEKALRLADYWPDTSIKNKFFNKLHGLRRYLCGPKKSYITQDDPTGFYESVFELPDTQSFIFKGNWVNEKYFSCVKDEIISDFRFPVLTEENNLKYAELIKNSTSVSVHIRKGDYINSQMLNLTIDYYKKAKIELENRISKPQYFIFTDDFDAVEEYIELFPGAILIENNTGEKSFRDMQMMSLCDHNIIANSTFSFWGAYLNLNEQKVVIGPSKAKYDFKNPFACEDWIVLEV